MDVPSIDVLIVHYHSAEPLRDAVHALRNSTERDPDTIRITVIDNGSTPDEQEVISSLPVNVLHPGGNLGYAGAINFAVPRTTAEMVVVMNEDVCVLSDCLVTLQTALSRGASVAGPKFYWDMDRSFVLPCTEERTRRNEIARASAARDLRRLHRARQRWRVHARSFWRAEGPVATTSLSGALLAFSREAWRITGPFDDRFRLYYEEDDWLTRAAGAGLRCEYVPAAEAIHLHDVSRGQAPERAEWFSESFLRFGNRHYGERFMSRLSRIATGSAVFEEPKMLEGESIFLLPSDVNGLPLWAELSPSRAGFPAASMRIEIDGRGQWQLPAMRGLKFDSQKALYIRIVDDVGTELQHFRLKSRRSPSPRAQHGEKVDEVRMRGVGSEAESRNERNRNRDESGVAED